MFNTILAWEFLLARTLMDSTPHHKYTQACLGRTIRTSGSDYPTRATTRFFLATGTIEDDIAEKIQGVDVTDLKMRMAQLIDHGVSFYGGGAVRHGLEGVS